jgi:hypothetical protein
VVSLVSVTIGLLVVQPAVGDWLGGALMIIASVWYWLPVVLRTGRTFAEGYRSDS